MKNAELKRQSEINEQTIANYFDLQNECDEPQNQTRTVKWSNSKTRRRQKLKPLNKLHANRTCRLSK